MMKFNMIWCSVLVGVVVGIVIFGMFVYLCVMLGEFIIGVFLFLIGLFVIVG